MLNWTLRRIAYEDALASADWVTDATTLGCWAGADLAWPIDTEALWARLSDVKALTLSMATEHDLLAMGQLCQHGADTLQLQLLMVNPAFRGRRLGEHMALALFKRGSVRWPEATRVALAICRYDRAALAMSQRLGFTVNSQVEDHAGRILLQHALPALLASS